MKSRGIRQDPAKANRIRPIRKQVDPLDEGLPANIDVERLTLGSVLLDGGRFSEVAVLTADDFALEKHRRIYLRICELHERGERIDRITVAEELMRCDQLESVDGLSYLVSLDDGMPHIAHLDSYVRILREKSALRRTIFVLQNAMSQCFAGTDLTRDILGEHIAQIEKLRLASQDPAGINRVEDLESIFANRPPTEYLITPELPIGAIVSLTGNSESGKTTLA